MEIEVETTLARRTRAVTQPAEEHGRQILLGRQAHSIDREVSGQTEVVHGAKKAPAPGQPCVEVRKGLKADTVCRARERKNDALIPLSDMAAAAPAAAHEPKIDTLELHITR